MPDFALEFTFDEEGAGAVEDAWLRLRFAGLPSQADHRSMTNAPHVSLVVARDIPQDVVGAAMTRLSPVMPAPLDVRGTVLFGSGARVTLAYLTEPPREVVDTIADLRRSTPALRHPVWTPHVTLGRRIPRERAGEALAAVGDAPATLVATRLRWWDPCRHAVDTLVGPG